MGYRWIVLLAVVMGMSTTAVRAEEPEVSSGITSATATTSITRSLGRPRVEVSATGTWVMVWDQMTSSSSATNQISEVFASRSTDAGGTWSQPQVLSAAADTTRTFRIRPDLATDGAGRWMAAWNARESPAFVNRIMVARSVDDGQTWQERELLNFSSYATAARVAVSTDRTGNWVVAYHPSLPTIPNTSIQKRVELIRSGDHGVTWGEPLRPENKDPNTTQSHGWTTVASAGPGKFLAVYELSINFQRPDHRNLVVIRSMDGGVTWGEVGRLPDTNGEDQPQLRLRMAELASNGSGGYLMTAESLMGPSYVATTPDLGSTWTMTQLPGQDRVISSMVAHGGGNRWYVASRIWENPTTSTTPQGSTQTRYEQAVQILASADNGQSWTVARTIRNYPHFMGNTDVAADGKGNVIVTWAGAEGNQPSTSSQIYAQRSTDHGATWGETMRIAPPGEPK